MFAALLPRLLGLSLVLVPALPDPEPDERAPGFLGVQFEDSGTGGLLVTHVFPNSPAARGGIREADVIRKFSGMVTADVDGFVRMIVRTRPGTVTDVEVRRGDATLMLKVKVGSRPGDFPFPVPQPADPNSPIPFPPPQP